MFLSASVLSVHPESKVEEGGPGSKNTDWLERPFVCAYVF